MFCRTVAGFLLAAVLAHGLQSSRSCYTTDPSPNRLYATKTAYDTVRSQEPAQDEAIPGCSALGLWVLARHGTRHTGVDDVEEMAQWFPLMREEINLAHAQGRGELCAEDLAGLDAWDSPMPDDQDKTLGEAGWREFRGLGDRYKTRYPTLLDVDYVEEGFNFLYSDHSSNRTRDTARAFVEGIFGSYDGISMGSPAAPDTLIRFYDYCPRYDEEVGDLPVVEMDQFIDGPEMASTPRTMAQRAGLNDNYFTYEDADVVYESCRVEYGLYGEAPWCALFSTEDIETFEYAEDIKYYWEDSYPHDISWQMTCDLNKDMVSFLRNHVESGQAPSLQARFGHSQTLNAFFTSLGLFEPEEDLLAGNWDDQLNRAFRVSNHTPMGSNIALALYQCDGGADYRIKAYVNEDPIEIPGCPLDDYDTCSYDDFAALFEARADNCNFEQICSVN